MLSLELARRGLKAVLAGVAGAIASIIAGVIAMIPLAAVSNYHDERESAGMNAASSMTNEIVRAQGQYRLRQGQYAVSLAELVAAGVLDTNAAKDRAAGYEFSIRPCSQGAFVVEAFRGGSREWAYSVQCGRFGLTIPNRYVDPPPAGVRNREGG